MIKNHKLESKKWCLRFLHQRLLRITLLCEHFTFDSERLQANKSNLARWVSKTIGTKKNNNKKSNLLGVRSSFMDLPSLLLPLPLEMIKAVAMSLPMKLNVITLRLPDIKNAVRRGNLKGLQKIKTEVGALPRQ